MEAVLSKKKIQHRKERLPGRLKDSMHDLRRRFTMNMFCEYSREEK